MTKEYYFNILSHLNCDHIKNILEHFKEKYDAKWLNLDLYVLNVDEACSSFSHLPNQVAI